MSQARNSAEGVSSQVTGRKINATYLTYQCLLTDRHGSMPFHLSRERPPVSSSRVKDWSPFLGSNYPTRARLKSQTSAKSSDWGPGINREPERAPCNKRYTARYTGHREHVAPQSFHGIIIFSVSSTVMTTGHNLKIRKEKILKKPLKYNKSADVISGPVRARSPQRVSADHAAEGELIERFAREFDHWRRSRGASRNLER
ncbi:hypothetical protein EI94DRAFT_249140 [Lactarius quietus]|nr:hypothetical protein EI94DRAFT_249140 [Lactarius quietus]